MIPEIIMLAVLSVSVPIAGSLAIHNIRELSELQKELDAFEAENFSLQNGIDFMEGKCRELERELEVERVNSKMLERALLDAQTSTQTNSVGLNLNDAAENDKDIVEEDNALKTSSPFACERLPDLPTNFYPAEYTTAITNTLSEQYKLQQLCHTEIGTGLRYYYDGAEEYYTVAMGGAYGDTIGDAWRVTLKCGSVFNVMRGDFKHALPAEPDDFGDICRNYDKQLCMCVLEFITDKAAMPRSLKDAGGFHALDFFGGLYGDGGNIVKMEYLGRRWKP